MMYTDCGMCVFSRDGVDGTERTVLRRALAQATMIVRIIMMLSASRAAAATGTILLFGSICIAGGLGTSASLGEGRFSHRD